MLIPPCPDCQDLTGGELCERCLVLRLFESVLREKPPDRPMSAEPTADFVHAGDQVSADLLPLKERASELPPTWSDGVPESLPDFGQLERICYIGHGGMGVVYKAFDSGLGIDVALKTVLPRCLSNPKVVSIFRKEIMAMARLKHPHIVHVYYVLDYEGRPFFTMNLIKGASLDCRLDEFCQAPRRAAELLVKVALAIHHAHERGVLHRDLKPANIILDLGGEPHVTDFGLAKQASTGECLVEVPALIDTASRVFKGIFGSIQYMSPEQATPGKEVTTVSDVYGLGATLYALLTGRPPFRGETVEDTLTLVRDGKPERPGEIRRRVPRDMEAICLKCLEKKPDDRYGTAKDLADDLQRFLDGKPVLARPAGAPRKLWMWAYRRPAQAMAASLAALFLLAVLAALFINEQARRRQVADAVGKALTAAIAGDLDAAERATAEAELAGASTGQAHMLRGQIALHRGQSREAREHLEQAVRLLPKSVAAWGMLAAAYADEGDWEQYDKAVREMEQLTPSTPEDFLFKGYAEANLEPERGLRTIQQAFDRRPMMGIAFLLRAEVRAFVAQDTDDLDEAERAVLDARSARELLRDNPTAIWVSLEAHLAKAGVHEHLDHLKQGQAELDLAGKDAEALKRFTKPPDILPEAVVFRWTYFREVGKEEEVLEELRQASKNTEHVNVTSCCALALYRRGRPGDLEEAYDVLERRSGTYTDRLLPFVLAELDYPDKHDWPARALKASEDYAARTQDWAAVMDAQSIHSMLGNKKKAVEVNKDLLKQPDRFYTLRADPIRRCAQYNAGELTEDKLLEAAGRSQWDQCLAHYNIAMTKLREGDRQGARDHFDMAVKTRAWGWGEYDLSWVFRDRLEDPKWPPRIPKERAK
jgi:tetratricopeptide (TPR) repeat protein